MAKEYSRSIKICQKICFKTEKLTQISRLEECNELVAHKSDSELPLIYVEFVLVEFHELQEKRKHILI